MNIKFLVVGFLVLATSEWTSKVSAQGDSSMNSTGSEASLHNLTPEENDTTSAGIGSSIPFSSTAGTEGNRSNPTA